MTTTVSKCWQTTIQVRSKATRRTIIRAATFDDLVAIVRRDEPNAAVIAYPIR